MIIKYKGRPLDEGLLKFEGSNLQAFPTIKHVKVFFIKASSIDGSTFYMWKVPSCDERIFDIGRCFKMQREKNLAKFYELNKVS